MKSNYEWLLGKSPSEMIEIFGELMLCLELVSPSGKDRCCDKNESMMLFYCKPCVQKWLNHESDIPGKNRLEHLQSLPMEEFAKKFETLICFQFRDLKTCGGENEQKCHACIMDWLNADDMA